MGALLLLIIHTFVYCSGWEDTNNNQTRKTANFQISAISLHYYRHNTTDCFSIPTHLLLVMKIAFSSYTFLSILDEASA